MPTFAATLEKVSHRLRTIPPHHWRRAAWWGGGLLVLIAILGFLVAPPLVRSILQEQAGKALGRTVSVERVRINPFALSATLEGLRIAEQDGQSEFLSFARVYANLEASSVLRGGPVLSALRVEQPRVHIARLADNRFNFSDILDRFAQQPKPADAEPLHFAVNNIELSDGSVAFDDVAAGQKHRIDKLELGLPFISSIPSQVEILVKPHLEAEVNGTPLELQGQLKPFADHREATLALQLEGFDLVRYLGYVPVPLPVKIVRAALDAKLECVWTEHDKRAPDFSLRGDLALSGVELAERDGAPLLALKQLRVGVQDLQPLAIPARVALRSVAFVDPDLSLHRFADGRLNVQRLGQDGTERSKAASAASVPRSASAPAAGSQPVAASKAGASPAVTIADLTIQGGRIRFQDEAVEGGFKTDIAPVSLQVQGFDVAGARDAALKAELQMEPAGRVGVQGKFNAARASTDLRVVLDALPLERYQPYYAFAIGTAKPTGLVSAAARIALPAGGGVQITEAGLNVQNLLLLANTQANKSTTTVAQADARPRRNKPAGPLLTLKTLAVSGGTVDVDKRQIAFERFASSDAELRVERDAQGKIDLLETLGLGNARQREARPEMGPLTAAAAETAGEWQVRTGKGEIRNWNVSMLDRTGRKPVSLNITNLGLDTDGFSTQRGSKGRFELNADINRKGRIRLGGQTGISPLAGDVKLDARAVDLVFLQPYVSSVARVLLTQGTLDARGNAAFDLSEGKAAQFSYDGDLAVSNFNSFDQINDADFLRWKNFAVKKLKLRSEPQSLSVGEVRLEDFYTRLILDAEGRFNLREMTRLESEPATPAVVAVPPAQSVPVAVLPKPAEKPLDLRIDQIVFSGGNVNFSDRFIKPNYDADLSSVTGSLKGLSPDQNSLAELSVKALMDRSAPVEISGQLNPLRQDKYLDIKARVSDVDLTSVSPYAIRYVGYGINKGKLSMDVNYRIRERRLTAENKVYLDQLTFGERVDSPEATKLPVLLAVSLLKDRNGVIDINLPISGTLDDPEFSVGGIIVRVIVNLLSKAVTSPFALLGAAFGGGEELSYLEFNAGLATLSKPAEEKLATLAKALADRPSLRLEMTGRADPVADIAGLKQASLNSRLRALKASQMVARGESAGEVDALVIKPEEYPQLLERVYRSATFEKPKNAIGMTKGLSVAEMEKLILDNTKITEGDLRSLANRREDTVRNWLVTEGKIPASRIFVIENAPASGAEGAKASPMRVDFSLK